VHDYECKNRNDEMLGIISQSEHPILFKPFFAIHPCYISQLLANFSDSKNIVLTFLTLFGPTVRLKMLPAYDEFYAER